MSDDLAAFRDALLSSFTDGEFTASVLWGALASGLAAIAEYNLTAMTGNTIEIQYSMLVGGMVAGCIYAGPRDSAARAGALASGIPVLLLGPLAFIFMIASGTLGTSVGWLLVASAFLFLMVLPIIVGFGMLGGAVFAFLTHWVLEQLLGSRTNGNESAT